MRTTQQEFRRTEQPSAAALPPSRPVRLWHWLKNDAGAVAIEYVIVAVALLAIAGAIAAALTTLGNDAVEQLPDSISGS